MKLGMIVVALLLTTSLSAQDLGCSENGLAAYPLRGWVGYTNTGEAVAGMTIDAASGPYGQTIASTMSDMMGRFSFGKLRPGTYYLKGTLQLPDVTVRADTRVTTGRGAKGIICLVAEADMPPRVISMNEREIYSGLFLGCMSAGRCVRTDKFRVAQVLGECCVLTIRNGDGRETDEAVSYEVLLNGERITQPTRDSFQQIDIGIAKLLWSNTLSVTMTGPPYSKVLVRIEKKNPPYPRKKVPETVAKGMLCGTVAAGKGQDTGGQGVEQLCGPVEAPIYPPLARAARIQGRVILTAVIDRDGSVKDVWVVSGHPMLAPAAVDAVKRWKYKPYVDEGQPVEVETNITVNFSIVE